MRLSFFGGKSIPEYFTGKSGAFHGFFSYVGEYRTIKNLSIGLNLINIHQLAAESYQEDRNLSLDYLRLKKKQIIESETIGLLEFIETEHDLSMVSGHDFVKKRFKSAARAIRQGRLDVLPMGYLISGPVGTGKTFMVTAFAGEIGIPIIRFRNFRSK